ncbi:porin [Aureivirga sp. CE67]|uniref:porin n=1 Tax=Aureivirga sp. CE67 TaxID=1788983 RepID=UPI0018CAF036|nr:porin [Aureivirga sp. CE67]
MHVDFEKINYLKKVISLLLLFFIITPIFAQQKKKNPFEFFLDSEHKRWVKIGMYTQFWGRYIDLNPGSAIDGIEKKDIWDISIRRFRLGAQMQATDKLFFVLNFGTNNINQNLRKGASLNILDLNVTYELNDYFNVGLGKSNWDGLSRYTSSSTSSLIVSDAISVTVPVNGVLDDSDRELNVFFKGKVKKLDYRLALSKGFYTDNEFENEPNPIGNIANFTDTKSRFKLSGYFKYEFLDQESNKTATSPGTYLGSKNIMSLGAGFSHLGDGLWYYNNDRHITYVDMQLFAVDFFLDYVVNKRKNAVFTSYLAFFNYDFGPNYVRSVAVNNPVNSSLGNVTLNGSGNAFPVIGTGNTVFTQFGFLIPNKNYPNQKQQLQPYVNFQFSDFEYLADEMIYFDFGINWLINKHNSKFTLNFQNRPIFVERNNERVEDERKWSVLLQYQFKI